MVETCAWYFVRMSCIRGGVGEIVFAVRQSQTALHQVSGIVLNFIESGRDPESEKICGVEVGVVERVDIGSQALAERAGQFALIVDGGNRCEMRRSGLRPLASMAVSFI